MRPTSAATLLLTLASTATAQQVGVSVMPGYPNAPHTNPSERFIARDGQPFRLWGNVEQGQSAPAGATYEWYLEPNGNVVVTDDGDLTDTITDPKRLVEDVTLELQNGATREILTATLMVTDPAGGGGQRSLEILLLADDDPDVDTPLEELDVDARIAVQRALWFLYDRQTPDDEWHMNGRSNCSPLSFALWALQNQGHTERNDPDEDIFSPVIARGYDRLFEEYVEVLSDPADLATPRATLALGAVADGVSDMNQNGRTVLLGQANDAGYYHPIALAGLIASGDPDQVVRTGPLAGVTFREVVKDGLDFLGATRNTGDDPNWVGPGFTRDGRGGWTYEPRNDKNRSDMSINGWAYVAMEGAMDVFGIDVPEWFKRETEHNLLVHMRDEVDAVPYGYTGADGTGALNRMATTAAGLTGLTVVLTAQAPGGVVSQYPNYVIDLDQQRENALDYLGVRWRRPGGASFGTGNRGNFYVMWAVARGLRATAASLGLPDGEKVRIPVQGEMIDWETGASPGVNEVPLDDREGYWSYLRRTQITDPGNARYGTWEMNHQVQDDTKTAMAILILTRNVFVDPCPESVEIAFDGFSPAPDGSFEAGVPFSFTGRAIQETFDRPVTDVFVDGRAVESLDATGRFFTTVMLMPGENVIEVEAFDSCGSTTTEVRLFGSTVGGGFDTYGDVSPFLELNFRNTTFNQANGWLVVDAEACSTYSAPLAGPILLALDATSAAAVTAVNPDGVLADGRPYFVFVAGGFSDPLAPGACTQPKQLIFENPTLTPFSFESTWLSPGNGPPAFLTSPPSRAFTATTFAYDAEARDPEGADVSYALLAAPSGMSVDPLTGRVVWDATPADLGTHQVVLEASDGTVGRTTQAWSLQVVEGGANEPPFFLSSPVVQAAVGAAYAYRANAADPNGDDVAYSLDAAPAGVSVDADGLVTWDFALGGAHPIVVRAADPSGAYALQGYTLSVGTAPTNPGAPVIDGVPGATATAGVTYRYQPIASDPDPGDELAFSLDVAPIGMAVDGATGLVEWTPGTAQAGPNAVVLRVEDGAGNFGVQSWSIDVAAQGADLPPSIVSLPPRIALVGAPYTYQVDAYDPEGEPLAYEVVAGPTGLTVDPTTGLVDWTPQSAGTETVALRAIDPAGGVGAQVFDVEVAGFNGPPMIVSSPEPDATVGAPWYYDVNALDPEGHALTYELTGGPGGVTIDEATGLLRWTPTAADLGTSPFAVTVRDPFGASDQQFFDVLVSDDTEAPTVAIASSPSPAPIGTPINICVQAGDNVGVVERTLSIGGVPAALSSSSCATETFPAAGPVDLVATARDAAGLITTEVVTLQVVDPNSGQRPEITLISPAPGDLLEGPVDIVASVTDDTPANLLWRVEYRAGDAPWTEIASGAGEVTAEPIARFDTTRLANGSYDVRVVAEDGVNAPWTIQWPLDVTGSYKLGDFETRFIDMAVPVAGFPMAVERVYSTLNPGGSPDFGPGWGLAFAGNLRDTAPEEGGTLQTAYTPSTRVYVALPTGSLQVFRFAPVGGFFFTQTVDFEPEGMSVGTLRPANVGDTICVFSGGSFFTPFEPYNPDLFVYTDPDGNEYLFSEAEGLLRITDVSGETIDVTPDGIVSSRGPAIAFERDASGRIVRAVGPDPDGDPNAGADGLVVEYEYDASGLLAAAGPANAEPIRYLYEDANFPLYLTGIVDPSGAPALRNKFDAEGLLIAQCGPEGDINTCEGCIEFAIDSAAAFQTVTTATGSRIDMYFSNRGDLVTERRWLDATTFFEVQFTYDADGRMLAEELPNGATTSWNYDGQGRMTAFTTPADRTWQILHGECGAESLIAPNGDVSQVLYDEDCRAVEAIDPLGNSTAVTFDMRGRMDTWTNPAGGVMDFDYGDNYLNGFTAYEGAFETVMPRRDGKLLFREDREGRRRTFTFDDQGRLTREEWSDGTVIEVAYNAAGFPERMENPEARIEWTYWPDGKMREQRTTYLSDGTVERVVYGAGDINAPTNGYDLGGRLASILDSHGGETLYTYDALGRVTSVRWPGIAPLTKDGAPVAVAPGSGVSAAPAGQAGAVQVAGPPAAAGQTSRPPAATVEFRWSDSVLGDSGVLRAADRIPGEPGDPAVLTTAYGYEAEGDASSLNRIEHALTQTGVTVADHALTLNENGFPVAWTDAEGAHTAVLDGANRILSVDHPAGAAEDESYAYDANGNRTESHTDGNLVHSIDSGTGSDRLLSSDNFQLEYDGVGSVTRLVERAPGGATYDLEYDTLRRVRRIERTRGGVLERTIEMDYDPLGRMIEQRVDGDVRRFVYDGANPILVTDGAGDVVERRLGLRGYDETWAVARGTELLWPLLDHVGTVRDWANADATSVDHLVYDTFGNPVGAVDPTLPAIGFQGRERIADTPLMDFRARIYDPRQGRFIGEDLRGPWGYSFAENNPLFYGDPTGESALIQYACLAGAGASWAVTVSNISGNTFRLSMEAVTLGLTGPENGSAAVSKAREAVQAFLTGITIDVAITAFAPDLPCAVSILDMTGEVAAAWGYGKGGLWSRLFGNDLKDAAGPPLMSAFGL